MPSPLFDKKNIRAITAEFLGTMMFVYVGVGSANQSVRGVAYGLDSAALLGISLCFGLAITAFVCVAAGFSGGHLNPAVTFGLCTIGEISWSLGLLYVLAQVIGGILGALFASLGSQYHMGFAVNVINQYQCSSDFLSPNDKAICQSKHCDSSECTEENAAYMWASAFVVETFGTFMLMLTVLMTAVHKKSVAGNIAPLAIGLTVFFAHMTSIPITNCGINPARSFGSAVVASWLPWTDATGNNSERITLAWEQMWFFWIVPIFGAVIGAAVFRLGFLDKGNAKGKKKGWDVNPVEENRGEGQSRIPQRNSSGVVDTTQCDQGVEMIK
jgi:MIP family channel proteins